MVTDRMVALARIVAECGVIAREAWVNRTLKVGQNLDTRHSETMDFFTTMDAELDNRLMAGLKKSLGINRFLTEEGSKIPERNSIGGLRAVIDSLDGSSNFATYRPDFGISIAIEQDGVPNLACIMTPARGELVIAEANQGTWLLPCYAKSLKKIQASLLDPKKIRKISTDTFALPNAKNRPPIERSRVYIHTGKRRNFELAPSDRLNTIYAKLANPGCSFSCSVALIEVALGKLDAAVIAYQNHWDYAAGKLLLQEAGGCFAAYDRNWSSLLSDDSLAGANATKDTTGDEWLANIIASGTPELFQNLFDHFQA